MLPYHVQLHNRPGTEDDLYKGVSSDLKKLREGFFHDDRASQGWTWGPDCSKYYKSPNGAENWSLSAIWICQWWELFELYTSSNSRCFINILVVFLIFSMDVLFYVVSVYCSSYVALLKLKTSHGHLCSCSAPSVVIFIYSKLSVGMHSVWCMICLLKFVKCVQG